MLRLTVIYVDADTSDENDRGFGASVARCVTQGGWRNCDDGYYVGSKGIIRGRGAGVMLCQRALLERHR